MDWISCAASCPEPARIWARAESFADIAKAMPSKKERKPDAVRRYFGRLLEEKDNWWIFDLLPGGVNPYI